MQASYLTRPGRAYEAAGQATPALWIWLPLLAIAFVVWQTVSLAQMRRFNRWFAVAFFLWWTIALIWRATAGLQRPGVSVVRALTVYSVLITTNLLSSWYLSRPSFRAFAVQFVTEAEAEKHSRLMEKIAQKRIRDDSRS